MNSAFAELEKLLVQKFLSPRAVEQFALGRIANSELEPYAEQILKISQNYNQHDALAIENEQMGRAYALYFTLINFCKIEFLLSKVPASFWTRPLRVLDYGCGPGTASLALKNFCSELAELVLIDSSHSMLKIARELLGAHWGTLPLGSPHSKGPHDLILAANVLNELDANDLKPLLKDWLEVLSENGVIVLLEPALKPSTHRAMQARDYLLAQDESLVPLFPCTRRDGCPMLKQDPENWCHGTLRWEEPQLVRQFDELLGFNKHRIKFCGFVLMRNGKMREGKRILGEPVKRKHGMEMLVCGPGVYGKEVVKKR